MANETAKTGTAGEVAILISVRVWSGGSASVVELANAGKRGKTCRTLTVDLWPGSREPRAQDVSGWIRTHGEEFAASGGSFEAFESECVKRAAGLGSPHIGIHHGEIRGIDAPVPVLGASGEKFTASASKDGIRVRDLTDGANEPTWITSGQPNSAAYAKAAKVWASIAPTMSAYEVSEILRNAGCKLHSFCAVD